MADEVEEPGIEVEVVPESEAEKPRLKDGDTRPLDVRDDELKTYGREVQDRIKKLRFAFHEERRQKEMVQRDLNTTNDFAQRLFRENGELKKNLARGEQAVIHQAIARVDSEIAQAKDRAKQAWAAGAGDEMVTSQERLARAVAEKERLTLLKDAPPAEAPPAAPPPPPQDERTREWFAKNPWWNQPGEEERTNFAKGVHEALAKRNITALANPQEYWGTINSRLAAVFPEHYKNGNGNGNGAEAEPPEPPSSRPLAVAGGTRSQAGAAPASRTKSIRLTESQVRLAQRLGVTVEQYAAELARMEGI